MSQSKERKTRRRSRGEIGQVLIIMAFAAFGLFAIIGLAIDAGRLYITKAQLSRAVDSAALSGILEFNGTVNGLTYGKERAREYFDDNEPGPGLACPAAPVCREVRTSLEDAEIADNEMVVEASKTVDLLFMSVLGIPTATVSAHAKAGFGVQFLDAALIIDATGSMDDGCNGSQNNSGCPIYEAKEAAKDFKDILLGTSPQGNTAVGVAALRGCYRANPQTQTAPMPMSSDYCVRDDNTSSTWVTDLTYNLSTLDNQIGNIYSQGGSGTNPCGGLAKGWEVLDGPGNHMIEEDNLRFLILLSDGDSNYYGHYTYADTPYDSPHTYRTFPCQVPDSCSATGYDVGGESTNSSDPCQDGVYQPSVTIADDNFDGPGSNCPSSWTSGPGWQTSSWTVSSSNISYRTSDSPNDTSCHVRIAQSGWMCRSIDLTGYDGGTLRFAAKRNSGWESSDDALVQLSTSADACTTGSGFSTVMTLDDGDLNTSYRNFSEDLDTYVDQVIYIRFQGAMSATSEYVFVDTIEVEAGDTGSSNGYVNGHNGSPANCSTAVRRERQLDILTWEMAKAIEADGVRIIVVGFGVCDPDPDIVYSEAQCEAQIGNNDHDNTADERLLKCIASSAVGENDSYYYADSSTDLPEIFTQIATQISHRLIE